MWKGTRASVCASVVAAGEPVARLPLSSHSFERASCVLIEKRRYLRANLEVNPCCYSKTISSVDNGIYEYEKEISKLQAMRLMGTLLIRSLVVLYG